MSLKPRVGFRSIAMRPKEDEFGLRLAAKAADRAKAAEQEWPAFEKRLSQLGYSGRAIAPAFSTLSGPGTVAEALETLKRAHLQSPPNSASKHRHLARNLILKSRWHRLVDELVLGPV